MTKPDNIIGSVSLLLVLWLLAAGILLGVHELGYRHGAEACEAKKP